ncbi:MAG: hypothetical protein ACYCVD_04225 [Desulfitobacteriaceae bacterium]
MAEQEREFEMVTLKDGRELKIIELTGLDEMIAAKIAGDEMNTGAGIIQYHAILHALSIKEMDGASVKRPTNLTEARALMAKFKMKDTSRIAKAFSKLNDDFEEKDPNKQGEPSAAELDN